MRQRYAYGSNIAAVRCGWDVQIKEQWRIKDSRIQSAAVLWLRHSFARAFSGDSTLFPLPCGGGKGVGCHVEVLAETSQNLHNMRFFTRKAGSE